MKKTLSVIKDRHNDASKLPVVGELADGRFADLSNPPSLAALKLHALMFKKAGGKVAEDCWHEISLAELRGVPGVRQFKRRGLIELLKELRGVVIEYDTAEETVIAGLLSISRVEFEDDSDGVRGRTVMRWKFDEGFRELVAASDYWALIDRQTALNMTSRYSLRLFEIMSVRFNLDRKVKETFTIAELRARLGVPDNKLMTWDHFRSRALDHAVAEINQLSRFIVTTRPIKDGRSVVAVEFSWAEKTQPALVDTKRELERHKAGRKARRDGAVENIVEAKAIAAEPFPETGSIHYGKWGELVRQHALRPTPDVDRVADAFRIFAQTRKINLASVRVEKSFIGFCKSFRP